MGCLVRRDRDSNGKLRPHSRCRKWELQVSVSGKGKCPKRSMRFSGTQREAKAALSRFEVEVENETPKSGWTFGRYADHWAESRAEDVVESTRRNHGYAIGCAKEAFGNVALERVDVPHLEKLKEVLAERYGQATQHSYWSTISSIFKHAVTRDRLIPANPMQYADAPRKPKRRKKSPSRKALLNLLSQLRPRDGGFHLAIVILVFAGIRRGECAGLLWSDVSDGGLYITKQYGKDTTKNKEERFVPLPSTLYSILDEMRGDDDEQVIARCGLPISGASIGTWWIDHRDGFGMTGVRVHDLRHAYVTLLQESGAPVAVAQALAGHSTSEMTLDVYTHPHEESLREAVDAAFDEEFAAFLR